MCESGFNQFAHSVRLAGCQHEVVAFAELHNSPHPFNVLRCVSPIALGVEIAEEQFVLSAMLDGSHCARNFATDESFTAPRTFMIEHDAVAGAETVALAIIHGCPVRKNLGNTIGTSRPEWRFLVLRYLLGFTEHFAA